LLFNTLNYKQEPEENYLLYMPADPSTTMPYTAPVLPDSEPNPTLLSNLAAVKRGCLVMVALLALLSLMGYLAPGLTHILPDGWRLMKAESALAALLSALSLQIAESQNPRWVRLAGMAMAGVVIVMACGVLFESVLNSPAGSPSLSFAHPAIATFGASMSPHSALGFLLVGISALLTRARKPLAVRLADAVIFLLCVLVLILVSGHIFGASHMFGPNATFVTSPLTLLCLMLLALVAMLRRTVAGVFSIFLGTGLGSRVARILSPFLLVLPFVREGARARMIGQDRMPPHYITGILATLSAVFALFLLLYMAHQINRMEREIRDLSLRDELTGLYNRRGFYLLAEQALRMAHRAEQPFSVLYVDVDNLKQINDTLGHNMGSEILCETAQILQEALRETDVVGRIGGDEFAVAGQFSYDSITIVAERLRESAVARNTESLRRRALSFSVGYVTSEAGRHESLDELLAQADEAMYREKRGKKQLRRVR
jgi:diguanylate cyclase (GGDEF)-like protein